ncbi:MAG: BatA domain-containing protein [Planctomycetota bacterium]
MFGLSFSNPVFFLGAAAVAIPVVLHLFHKRHSKSIDFSTFMFLRMIKLRMAGRRKLSQLVLLILRAGIIALFVLALAKPVMRASGGRAINANSSVVIVIDNSYSMAYKERGVSQFEIAKERARAIISTLKSGDSASIIATCRAKENDLGFSSDMRLIERELDSVNIAYTSAAMVSTLSNAAKLLGNSSDLNKELYVISDFQKLSFKELSGLEKKTSIENASRIFLVDVGKDEAENLAVTDIEVERRPDSPDAVKISATIRNFSGKPETCKLLLVLGDKTRQEESVTIQPETNIVVSFQAGSDLLSEQGLTGYISLITDACEPDNKRYFTMERAYEIPVLVVTGDPSDLWDIDETFFLIRALRPVSEKERGSKSHIVPHVVTSTDMLEINLGEYACVFLANVRHVPKKKINELESYIKSGGGLVIFTGDKINLQSYNSDLHSADTCNILPCELIGTHSSQNNEGVSLIPVDFNHPLFQRFKSYREELFSTIFSHTVTVVREDKNDPDVRILAKFSNNLPAVLERKYGVGAVLLFAIPCDRDWSNFPLRAAYLPVMHQAVDYLSKHKESAVNYLVGEPAVFNFPKSEGTVKVFVTNPISLQKELDVSYSGSFANAVYSDTSVPGIYYVGIETEKQSMLKKFSVNVNTQEGEIQKVNIEELKSFLQAKRIIVVPAEKELQKIINQARTGVELWDYLIYVAIVMVLLETFFANRFVPSLSEKVASPVSRLSVN